MKHTEGPWFAIHHPDGAWTVQDQEHGAGNCIAMRYGDSSFANAHLIAAAPDLLEVLEAIENHLQDGAKSYSAGQFLRDRARVAIAKARGETE